MLFLPPNQQCQSTEGSSHASAFNSVNALAHLLRLVLWHCWLGGRKDIRPVKTDWWGAGVVICLEQGADLHTVQLMPLPLIVSCFSKIQIGFTFLVPAHLGSPGQRVVKRRVCVCTRMTSTQQTQTRCLTRISCYLLLVSTYWYWHHRVGVKAAPPLPSEVQWWTKKGWGQSTHYG